ncbi:MAG: nucleotide exchange factor GrpE, partial [Bacilli bacterium]
QVINTETDDPALKNYLIGFKMINQNFKNILTEEGIKKIYAKVGEEFDAKYHHVLQTEWNEKYKEKVILQVMQSGYMYKDRVLRPVLVKVNKKEGK